VLAVIVIHAVVGMIRPRSIWRLRQVRVPDFWLSLTALLGVVLIEVMAGLLIGVVLSLVLLQRLSTPNVAVLGRHPERGIVAIDANPGTRPVPDTVILRTDGPWSSPASTPCSRSFVSAPSTSTTGRGWSSSTSAARPRST
jgi:MFS superfamily sulfate permease-like transporter